ncbi:MAG: hypothetical protein KY464_16170 [Gemmatimonadetes bacterium]|nr:hypothetical protein [Gemmatimonadota bacterium]
MNAKVSTPRLLLGVIALAVAWAPAATLARPGAEHPAFATQASAQARPASPGDERPAQTKHDSVRVPAI